jgi:ferrous iron transport protein B
MNCHDTTDGTTPPGPGRRPAVALVGNPNVGKSVLFAAMTGRYVTVSNYPGTTVEVARGTFGNGDAKREAIDTPGVRSIAALSDDERVTQEILLARRSTIAVQVIDAKDLRRGLLLTAELGETGVPLVVALNMSDEARDRGILIDPERLAEIIGVPVVPTVAPRREGVSELVAAIDRASAARDGHPHAAPVERAVGRIEPLLRDTDLRRRGLALMLLAGHDDLAERLGLGPTDADAIDRIRREVEEELDQPIAYALNRHRLEVADAVVREVVRRDPARERRSGSIGRWAAHPVAGWPILTAVLVAMYLFVGRLGAGVLVNALERGVFGRIVNPAARRFVGDVVPTELVQRFLVGRYGLVTMALTYGLAIILPIVATFFLAFGLLEDSGYLPRLAVMLDRAFRRLGLNGKAVLPMMLGLGCVTMATVSTRILETRRERLQVTLLLALAIPCSAQLGVILGMIGDTGAAGIAIWSAILLVTLLAVAWLAAKVIPGAPSDFILELPPMRVPPFGNVARKTIARVEWYLREVIPVFVLGTAALFALDETGALRVLERAMSPLVVGWLGLPTAATAVLLVGFLRRDYGAAGLFALASAGALDARQLLVSLVVITLFVPCIASVMMIVKEHGARTAAAIVTFVLVLAFAVGGGLHLVLEALRVPLG